MTWEGLFIAALDVRIQFEHEHNHKETDGALSRIYGETVYPLLKDRHFSRPSRTAWDRAHELGYAAAPGQLIPPLLASIPDLVEAWTEGREWRVECDADEDAARREAARKEAYRKWLQARPLPSAAELLAQAKERGAEIDGHHLHYDDENEVIWLTNPYGVDCTMLEATEAACQTFLANMRKGVEYGPIP